MKLCKMAGSYWLISWQGICVYRSRSPGVQTSEYKYNPLPFLVATRVDVSQKRAIRGIGIDHFVLRLKQ